MNLIEEWLFALFRSYLFALIDKRQRTRQALRLTQELAPIDYWYFEQANLCCNLSYMGMANSEKGLVSGTIRQHLQ